MFWAHAMSAMETGYATGSAIWWGEHERHCPLPGILFLTHAAGFRRFGNEYFTDSVDWRRGMSIGATVDVFQLGKTALGKPFLPPFHPPASEWFPHGRCSKARRFYLFVVCVCVCVCVFSNVDGHIHRMPLC